jgi:hypothetical protein
MSKKEPALDELWMRVKVAQPSFEFSNDLVKEVCAKTGFKNPFDLTKIDTSEDLPRSFVQDDVFVVHLGGGRSTNGKHRFVRGVQFGYHALEEPTLPLEEKRYTKTLLDDIDNGEAATLSTVFNQGLVQLFLYGDETVRPRIHLPGRTSGQDNTFDFHVGTQAVHVNSLQIEMDFIIEKNGDVAFAEAKRGAMWKDFAVAQVFMPYLKLSKMRERTGATFNIRPLFVMAHRKEYQSERVPKRTYDHIRLYEYRFDNSDGLNRMEAIQLVKAQEFVMIPRQ